MEPIFLRLRVCGAYKLKRETFLDACVGLATILEVKSRALRKILGEVVEKELWIATLCLVNVSPDARN